MAWFVVLAVLVVPFLLAAHRRRLAARLMLALFWISCVASGIWFLVQARRVEEDIRSVRLYLLPDTAGSHSVRVARPSQGSLKGTLRGGAGPLRREDLEKLHWSFAEPVTFATWFDAGDDDGPEPGEVFLFAVDEWQSKEPLTVRYRIEESQASLLRGRMLVVGHDRGAKHLLRDHAQVFLDLSGWALTAWGGLWLIVQVSLAVKERRPGASGLPA